MIVLVTGTGTDVGKTVTTAALAAYGESRGYEVSLVKPVQTGEPPGSGDLATITALTGITDTHCFATCPEPLAPVTAARRAGIALLGLEETVRRVRALDRPGRLVLVEGAGGVLVQLGDYTIADLAVALQASVVVVTTTFLGSLNHLALTLEALANRDVRCLGAIGGSVPPSPDLATCCTLDVLRTGELGVPWLGELPAGAGTPASRAEFRTEAVGWLGTASMDRHFL
jgi:dethiobiotin synthetase